MDFGVVVIGYGLSGEPTLHAFYEQLAPFAEPFMALDAAKPVAPSLDPCSLSGRSRSGKCGGAPQAFSRGSACAKTVCFRLSVYSTGREHRGWWSMWMERGKPPENLALPQTEAFPPPHRRFDQVSAPCSQGPNWEYTFRTPTLCLHH